MITVDIDTLSGPLAGHLPQNCEGGGSSPEAPANFWYALHVRSRHEKMVAGQLGALNIPHWLPLIELRKRWSDRFMTVREPLFPGYLFVSPPMEELLSVARCRGVVRLVGPPGRPHPVEPRELEAVRAALAGRLRCDPCPYLSVGGEVEVTRGPLKGFRGILVRKGKNCKLVLSVRLISQSIAVEINASDAQGV